MQLPCEVPSASEGSLISYEGSADYTSRSLLLAPLNPGSYRDPSLRSGLQKKLSQLLGLNAWRLLDPGRTATEFCSWKFKTVSGFSMICCPLVAPATPVP